MLLQQSSLSNPHVGKREEALGLGGFGVDWENYHTIALRMKSNGSPTWRKSSDNVSRSLSTRLKRNLARSATRLKALLLFTGFRNSIVFPSCSASCRKVSTQLSTVPANSRSIRRFKS